jgi:hypothetical protein
MQMLPVPEISMNLKESRFSHPERSEGSVQAFADERTELILRYAHGTKRATPQESSFSNSVILSEGEEQTLAWRKTAAEPKSKDLGWLNWE